MITDRIGVHSVLLPLLIYHQIEQIGNWTSSTLNNVLTIGNNPCVSIKQWISSYTTDHKTVLDHMYTNMSHLHVNIQTGVLESYFTDRKAVWASFCDVKKQKAIW